ncbi:MAG TPA: EAL domain-containing protein [Steroidobacteraceae bacterium]|nr:EAL domain-containing protein [Steroidobacteraceae bacterium]
MSVPDAAATCRTRSLLMPEAALTGSELRRALDEHDLGLQYQPKVACDDERLIVGVEALIRWNHPELGLLLPDRILPLAERSCLLTEVTDFTITEAIHQYSIWRARGIDLPISVNLAPGLIKDGGFPERLLSSLSQFNVPPARLTLEVKETHSVADRDLCIDVFERLRGAGVGLALDDYGIGLSSLTEFYKLPFSEVKIDGRLIKDAAYSASARTILRAIVRLAHELSIHATAESVETRAEFACVHAAGCDSAQGDLLCAPQPPPGLEQFLTGRRACFATAQSWSPFAVQPAVTQ